MKPRIMANNPDSSITARTIMSRSVIGIGQLGPGDLVELTNQLVVTSSK
jgi:hypothetical protein